MNTVENMNIAIRLPISIGTISLFLVLPLLSAGLCFVFEPKSRMMGFYLGASILALLFNFVPQKELPDLKLKPNSAKVSISFDSSEEIKETEVTVIDLEKNQIVGRTDFVRCAVSFYLDDGHYLIQIIPYGYGLIEEEIRISGDAPVTLGPYDLQMASQSRGLQGFMW